MNLARENARACGAEASVLLASPWPLAARICIGACLAAGSVGLAQEAQPVVIVVVGAGGSDQFAREFQDASEKWLSVAAAAGAEFHRIGDLGSHGDIPNSAAAAKSDRELLESSLRAAALVESPTPVWLVLIGHGTFDNKQAKFNLRGPDVSAKDLVDWCSTARRPLIIANCSSSSGPFLGELKGPSRVVITATRSGAEQNYSRFAKYFAETIGDVKADLDKDDRVSLLEAYIAAAKRTAEFYEGESRLATEHSLLDDNGDGLGTAGDWFRGIRSTRAARDGAPLDGAYAHRFHLLPPAGDQNLSPETRAERARLELAIEDLRAAKSQLAADEYYRRLERLLVELARLNAVVGR